MVELGELEKRHQDFAARNIRIVVVSNDDQETAQATKADFPNLVVVSDADQNLAKAIQVLDPGAGPGGSDSNAPTTFLLDGAGSVRWFYRPHRFLVRLSPDEVLIAIDVIFPRK